jgi:hypothetical protein
MYARPKLSVLPDLIAPHVREYISNPRKTIFDVREIENHLLPIVPELAEVYPRQRRDAIKTVLMHEESVYPDAAPAHNRPIRFFYKREGSEA